MKRYNNLLSVSLIVIFLLAACGARQATLAPSSQAVTEPPVELSTSTEVSTLPIDLSGPPPGTPMVWVDGSILVHVPGSEFIMGGEGTDNPVHKVGLSSFWFYRTKVTNRMYNYCVAAGKCAPPKDQNSLKDFNDTTLRDAPVAGVDWEQADAYCKFIEGHLPTEAEWEKAARGPDGNVYPWGDAAPGCTLLNFNGDCVGKKTKVFDYPTGRSFYTALDMAGNAFEWTGDWYDPNYYGASPVADPPGPEAGTVRTVRGSSYQSDQTQVPSYRRFFLDPKIYRPDLGFRCVVENPHPFAPLCSQILVPGKLGNENLGGQPADPGSCKTPTVTIDGKCTSATGTVTNGVIDSVEGGNCQLNGNDGFFCSGTGSTNVKVCIQCDKLKYPKGGGCGIGQYQNTVSNSCDSKGQPGQCPSGFTLDSVNKCCIAGPGISYPGCGSGETLENNQCVPGISKKPGCDYITVDLNQGCPTKPACEMTADSCNASCSQYGGNFNQAACKCDCIPTPIPPPPGCSSYGDSASCNAGGCSWITNTTTSGGSCQ
jgi:formylglycine-generating enzyme required for sulfatase activity